MTWVASDAGADRSVVPLIEAIGVPSALLDADLRVCHANDAFRALLGAETDILMLAAQSSVWSRLREWASGGGLASLGFEIEAELPTLGVRRLGLRAMRLLAMPADGATVLLTIEVTALPGRGLAAATHDLRQPLQVMTLLGSLLARRISDPTLLPLLARLEDSIVAISGMLNSLLRLERHDGSPDVLRVPSASVIAEPAADALPGRGMVFVVDDDAAVCDAMRELLQTTGWASEGFASGEAFLAADHAARTGCVLVDAVLPGMSGVDLLRTLHDRRHRLPAIMLTGAGDVPMAVAAMRAGALDFIEKPVRYEAMLPSLRRAFELLADVGARDLGRQHAAARVATLTQAQRRILGLVLEGQPSRNIAVQLGVSRRTVENHRAAIMKKMQASSIAQLIRVGIAGS